MNLKDAQTLEKSLRMRAGSLNDLSNGLTTRRRFLCDRLDIPEHMQKQLLETSRHMSDTAKTIQHAIDKVMKSIEVDV